MEFDHLLKLIETVSQSGLTAFQYEEKGVKIKMGKTANQVTVIGSDAAQMDAKPVAVQNLSAETTVMPSEVKEEAAEAVSGGKVILSPLVGTFYAAPAEDAEPYVTVGDTVKKGQTLAIVEAMKLMNEIESEYDGVIEEIYVENGQPVEYDQPLFRLK